MDCFTEQLVITEGDLDTRVLRGDHHIPIALSDLPTRKRKQLTPQQLEERRKKVGWINRVVGNNACPMLYGWCVFQREEARAKKLKLMEEAEKKRKDEKARKRYKWPTPVNSTETFNPFLEM